MMGSSTALMFLIASHVGCSAQIEDGGHDKYDLFDRNHPHALKVIGYSYRYLNVTWMEPKENSSDVQYYVVHSFKKPFGNLTCPPTVSQSIIVDSNVTYQVLKGLSPGTTYGICVQANFSDGLRSTHIVSYTTKGYGVDNECNCSVTNYVDATNPCNQETGLCNCKTKYLEGPNCDRCVNGYYMVPNLRCIECGCTSPRATGNCFLKKGNVKVCECKGNFGHVDCSSCKPGFLYNRTRKICEPCQCSSNTRPRSGVCNAYNGECFCGFNTTGANCELCKEGYIGSALNKTCMLPSKEVPDKNDKGKSPVPETSSFQEISFIIIICVVVATALITASVLIIYCVRKNRGRPIKLWTIQLGRNRDNVSFQPVVDQQPDLCLLGDDGVQYFERDDDVSPTAGGRLQLQFPGTQYRNGRIN